MNVSKMGHVNISQSLKKKLKEIITLLIIMNLESTNKILLGSSLALVSNGLRRSVSRTTCQSVDTCVRTQLQLGLLASTISGLIIIYRSLRV